MTDRHNFLFCEKHLNSFIPRILIIQYCSIQADSCSRFCQAFYDQVEWMNEWMNELINNECMKNNELSLNEWINECIDVGLDGIMY